MGFCLTTFTENPFRKASELNAVAENPFRKASRLNAVDENPFPEGLDRHALPSGPFRKRSDLHSLPSGPFREGLDLHSLPSAPCPERHDLHVLPSGTFSKAPRPGDWPPDRIRVGMSRDAPDEDRFPKPLDRHPVAVRSLPEASLLAATRPVPGGSGCRPTVGQAESRSSRPAMAGLPAVVTVSFRPWSPGSPSHCPRARPASTCLVSARRSSRRSWPSLSRRLLDLFPVTMALGLGVRTLLRGIVVRSRVQRRVRRLAELQQDIFERAGQTRLWKHEHADTGCAGGNLPEPRGWRQRQIMEEGRELREPPRAWCVTRMASRPSDELTSRSSTAGSNICSRSIVSCFFPSSTTRLRSSISLRVDRCVAEVTVHASRMPEPGPANKSGARRMPRHGNGAGPGPRGACASEICARPRYLAAWPA
jgi:hypothetical protein